MHPPLERPHPDCQAAIAALVLCHEERYVAKWVGACNDAKAALDECFRREKEAKRDANLVKARDFDRRFEQYLAKKAEKEKWGPRGARE